MELLRNNYYKSARHARIILPVRPAGGSGIQILKNLDSRYKLAGMTYCFWFFKNMSCSTYSVTAPYHLPVA